MKHYISPEFEIIPFESADVIAMSVQGKTAELEEFQKKSVLDIF